jgi:nucleotide-binding universal stress UspA family protein
MKTVIVPIDFSDTSLNAAEYAVRFFQAIIVLKLFYTIVMIQNLGRQQSENLGNLRKRLWEIASLDIVLLAEKGEDFLGKLEKLARHRQADLVIMGITVDVPGESKDLWAAIHLNWQKANISLY